MRWFWTAALALALTATGCRRAAPPVQYQTGVQLQSTFEIPPIIEGIRPVFAEMRYLLYLPEGYGADPDRLWPLIFFLHGSGDDDYDSAWVMSYGLPAVLYLEEEPDDFDFVVVSPQAFPGTSWWDGDQLLVLNALLDHVLQTYGVDPARVYLTGLSMGGYGSWYLATRYPDRFAAVVSISGSGYRTQIPPDPNRMCVLKDLPVWVIHGEQDLISDPRYNHRFVNDFARVCGAELRTTFWQDTGHFATYERAYRDPALYDWLQQQARQ